MDQADSSVKAESQAEDPSQQQHAPHAPLNSAQSPNDPLGSVSSDALLQALKARGFVVKEREPEQIQHALLDRRGPPSSQRTNDTEDDYSIVDPMDTTHLQGNVTKRPQRKTYGRHDAVSRSPVDEMIDRKGRGLSTMVMDDHPIPNQYNSFGRMYAPSVNDQTVRQPMYLPPVPPLDTTLNSDRRQNESKSQQTWSVISTLGPETVGMPLPTYHAPNSSRSTYPPPNLFQQSTGIFQPTHPPNNIPLGQHAFVAHPNTASHNFMTSTRPQSAPTRYASTPGHNLPPPPGLSQHPQVFAHGNQQHRPLPPPPPPPQTITYPPQPNATYHSQSNVQFTGEKWSGKGSDCTAHSISLFHNRVRLNCESTWGIHPNSRAAVLKMHGMVKGDGLQFYEENIYPKARDDMNFTLDEAFELVRRRFIDPKSWQIAHEAFYDVKQSSDLTEKDRPTVHQLSIKIQHLAQEMYEVTPLDIVRRFFDALDHDYKQEIRRINGGEPFGKTFQQMFDLAVLAERTVDSQRVHDRNYRPPPPRRHTNRTDRSDRSNRDRYHRRQGDPGPAPNVSAATVDDNRQNKDGPPRNQDRDRRPQQYRPDQDRSRREQDNPRREQDGPKTYAPRNPNPSDPRPPRTTRPRDDQRTPRSDKNKGIINVSACGIDEDLGFEHGYAEDTQTEPTEHENEDEQTYSSPSEQEDDDDDRYFISSIALAQSADSSPPKQEHADVDLSIVLDSRTDTIEDFENSTPDEPSFSGEGYDREKAYVDYFVNEILSLADNEWQSTDNDVLSLRMLQTHLYSDARNWFHTSIEPYIETMMLEEVLGALREKYTPRLPIVSGVSSNGPSDRPAPDNASIKIRGETTEHRPRVHDCLTVDALVSGKMARLMVDTGAGMDFLADKFISAYDLPYTTYDKPLKLSLATSGSSGTVQRWTRLPIQIQGKVERRTWEIAHLSSWDGILGSPFLFDYAAFIGLNPPSITFGKLPNKVRREGITLGDDKIRLTPKTEDKDSPGISAIEPPLEIDSEEDIEKAREEIRQTAKSFAPSKIPLGGAERPTWMQHTINPVRPRDGKIKSYPVPQRAAKSLMKKLQVMEEAGVIRRPQGPVLNADPLFVKIKPGRFDSDGDPEIRLLFDLRGRNASVNKVLSPLPDQEQIVRELANSRYKTRIDLTNAYEQIRLTPDSIQWTAFATPIGFFEITVMQQGDNNAAATFQNIIWRLFAKRIPKDIKTFLDDVYVHNKNLRQHVESCKIALKILDDAKLYSNPDKLKTIPIETECLGRQIHMNGSVKMSRDQRQAILDWPEPRDSLAVSRFLGMVNWVASNLPKCAQYTSVLSELGVTSKRAFQWNDTHRVAFTKLKALVHEDAKLYPIDYSLLARGWKIFVFSDASNWGTGGWIGMGTDWQDAHLRPALFHSRKFNKTQLGYHTHGGELLALYDMIRSHESMLIGYKFTVCTDNTFVSQLMTIPTLTDRERRIAAYLNSFDTEIIHIPGPKNWAADALSRLYENHTGDVPARAWHEFDHELQDDDAPYDIENRLSSVNLAHNLEIPMEPFPREQNEQFAVAVRNHLPRDKTFSRIYNDSGQYKGYIVDDGLLWLILPDQHGEGVLCVPEGTCNGRQLREIVTNRCHRVLGHLGYKKTIEYVRHHFWWPTVAKDVKTFCQTCDACNRAKNAIQKSYGYLQPIIPVPKKWHMVSMDWVQLKEVMFRGRMVNEILMIRDMYQGIVRGVYTHTARTATETAEEYMLEIYKTHGLPDIIVSDRDPVFTGAMWRDMCILAGITSSKTTAFHPQADGSTEITNRTGLQMLTHLISSDQNDWPYQWPHVEFAINSAISASLGVSPFELWQGYLPRVIPDLITPLNKASEITAIEWAERTTARQLSAHDNLITSRIQQATQANKKRRATPAYSVGDQVWLSTKNLKLANNRVRKLSPKWIGPLNILGVSDAGLTLKLDLGEEFKKRRIFPKFHVEKIRPYIPLEDSPWPNRSVDTTNSIFTIDPNLFLIDYIKDHKVLGRKNAKQEIEFFVSWCSEEDSDSWVTKDVVDDLPQLAAYLKKRKVSTVDDLINVKAGSGSRAQRAQARADASFAFVTVDPEEPMDPKEARNRIREYKSEMKSLYGIDRATISAAYGYGSQGYDDHERDFDDRNGRPSRGRSRSPSRRRSYHDRYNSRPPPHSHNPTRTYQHNLSTPRPEDIKYPDEPTLPKCCYNCGDPTHMQNECPCSTDRSRLLASKKYEKDFYLELRRCRVVVATTRRTPHFEWPTPPPFLKPGCHIQPTSNTSTSSSSTQLDQSSTPSSPDSQPPTTIDKGKGKDPLEHTRPSNQEDLSKGLDVLNLENADEEMADTETSTSTKTRFLQLNLLDKGLDRPHDVFTHNTTSVTELMDVIINNPCIGDARAAVETNPNERYFIRMRDEIIDRSSDANLESNLNNYDNFFKYMMKKINERSEGGFLDHAKFIKSVYKAQTALHKLTHASNFPSFDLPSTGYPILQDRDEKQQEMARILWLIKMFIKDKTRIEFHINALTTSEDLLKYTGDDTADVNDLRVITNVHVWSHKEDFVPGFHVGSINEKVYN